MPAIAGPDLPASERVTYQFELPAEDWREWGDVVPRSTPKHERLYTLIQIDLALNGETDISGLNLLVMKLERVGQRAANAQDALDRNDPQKARAELEEIEALAADLVG